MMFNRFQIRRDFSPYGLTLFSFVLAMTASACAAISDGSSSKSTPPSDIQYAANPASYVIGNAITANKPATTRSVTKYSVTPALPTGLALDTLTGVISGTPTKITSAANYAVQATNSFGSSFINVLIAVTDHAPTIAYGGATTLSYTVGTPVSTITPTLGGGATVACQSIPALPAGLSLSASCVLSGTPTVAAPTATNYKITAINSGGAAALTLNIQVIDLPPAFTYTSGIFSLVRGTAVTSGTPTSTGGVITSCAASPTLPAGITLAADCTLAGTPTALAGSTSYTITATNSGGTAGRSITLDVHDIAPAITYSSPSYAFTLGKATTPATAATASNAGGFIAGCASVPALPTGLNISTSDCSITGTPTALSGSSSYTITATNSAGTSSQAITISVIDVAPTIAYIGAPYTFTHGTAITPTVVHTTGGAIVGCSSSPALPAGLVINPTTCVISGTPTVSAASSSYAITATNSGGTGSATIAIKVNAIAPNLTYTNAPFITWDKNVTITTQTPTNSGDAVTSCSSSPALPAGLSLSPTCVISGSPTVIAANATYTISATNSIGTGTTPISVTVNDTPPAISYAGSPFAYTTNVAITALNPASTGGAVVSCASSPALPTGLALSTSCVLTGTPTAITAAANYTITATNAGGTGSAIINIAVNDAVPVISFTGSPFTYTRGTLITTLTDTNTGGAITSCSSSPTLPAGLTVAVVANNCSISGTPTTVLPATSYTITAVNSGGSGSAAISITVIDILPAISYSGSPFTFPKNSAITAQTPTNTGGPPTSCSTTPSLPAGLSISNLCVISGTPTVVTPTATWGVTATNSAGSASTTISITVSDTAPSITYAGSPFTFTKGTAITTLTPTNTGGAVISCAASPTLPTGLSLSSTCVISGTPTVISGATAYTITATNSGGSSAPSINIRVNDAAPTVAYTGSPFAYTKGTAITTLTPTTGGGAITGCTSAPSLPTGLSIANTTCVITGTPTVVTASASYTITATNTGGSATANITIAVNDIPPTLSYAGSPFTYTKGTAITTLTPTTGGGAITGCSSSPILPAGLSLAATTCVLTGTPTAVSAATSYTITAVNSGGTASGTISIAVNDVAPVFSYATPAAYTSGSVIPTLSPTVTAGTPTACSSSPGLPTGLSISSTCVITGTPAAGSAATSYTITATNTGGSGSASVTLSVNSSTPVISYSGTPYLLLKSTAISPAQVPTNTGGAINSCAISPALPAGMSFSTVTCSIAGTPTVTSGGASYTVTATNANGTGSTTINVTVNDALPALTYAGSPYTLTVGTSVGSVTPTNSGGTITACSVSPTLPTGLALAATTCVITGTPTAVTATDSYTISSTSTGGTSSVNITVSVNDKSPTISYTAPPAYTVGTAIATLTPSYATGGTVTSCSVAPSLPAGLVLSSTCVLTGTPTTITSTATYTVTAANTGGSGTASLSLTINDRAPVMTYTTPGAYSVGTTIAPLVPANTGGAITGCSVAPTLPAGLTLSSGCVISGTPASPTALIGYSVTATNSGGSSTPNVNLRVNDAVPALTYAGAPFTLTVGTALSAQTPSNTGGAPTSCSSSPVLPAGLSLSTTCVISGTPTVASANTTYSITPVNGAGTGLAAAIHITINDVAPAISFSPSSVVEVIRTAVSTINPVNSGGVITSCSPSPALPAGLSLSATCSITGTPTALSASTAYSITATNTGGSSSATINIQVKNQPQLVYYGITNSTPGTWNSTATSSYNIWTATQDGVSLTLLTANTAASLDSKNPTWGPTGSNIFYGSKRAQNGATNGATSNSYDMWTSTATGTSPAHLTANTAASLDSDDPPVVSPDGTKIAYASKQAITGLANGTASLSYNIFVANSNGTGTPTAITQNTNVGLDSKSPVWSPDGTLIYYQSKMSLTGTFNAATNANVNIWRINATGTGMTALTTDNTAGLDSATPAISPSGLVVVYATKEKIGATTPLSYNIWTMNNDGTSKASLTTNTLVSLDSTNPKWSPDGTEITFQSKMKVAGVTANSYNIWKMGANGLSQVALTTNTVVSLDSQMPNFSPDNLRIAFYSKQKFNATTPLSNNLWVMKSDGTAQSAITQNTNTGLDCLIGPFAVWYAP